MVDVLRCPMEKKVSWKKYSIGNGTQQKISRTWKWFLSNNVCSIRKLKWNYSITKEDCVTTPPIIRWRNYCREMYSLRLRFDKIFRLSPKTISIPDCQYIIRQYSTCKCLWVLVFPFFSSYVHIAYMNKFSFMMSTRICGSWTL